MTKKQKQANEQRITKIYGKVASGIQVPIMKLPAISNAGMSALLAGGDDEAIGAAISGLVETFRIN